MLSIKQVFAYSIKQIFSICFLVAAFLSVSIFGQIPKSQEAQALPANQVIERELAGGQSHFYRINLKANEFLQVKAEQKGVDIVVRLFHSNQKQLTEIDSPWFIHSEELLFITDQSGEYEIQISASPNATTGSYSLQWSKQIATEKERLLVNAKNTFDKALKLFPQSDKRKVLLTELEKTRKMYQEIGDLEGELKCLQVLVLSTRGVDNVLLRQYYNQAVLVARKIKRKSTEAKLLLDLGKTYVNQEPQKEIEHFNQALTIAQEIDDKILVARILSEIAYVYNRLGNSQKYIEYVNRAISTYKSENTPFAISSAISLITSTSNFYERQGNKKLAEQFRAEGDLLKKQYVNERKTELPSRPPGIVVKIEDSSIKANELFNKGDYKNAIKYYEQALIQVTDGTKSYILSRIGSAYSKLGEKQKAIEYFDKALLNARSQRNKFREAGVFDALGDFYSGVGDYPKAVDFYNQSLLIYRALEIKDVEISLLRRIRNILRAQGKIELAILFGKQLVNLIQQFRYKIKELDSETQKAYLRLNEARYRELAELFIIEGRFPEAQAVLDLLKEEEFRNYTVRRSGETPDIIPYSKTESEVAVKVDNLAKLEQERAELLKQKEQGSLSADKQARLDKIPAEIESANKAFRLALDALSKTEASSVDRIAEIQSEKSLQRTLSQLQKDTNSGVVALYTLLGTEESSEVKANDTTNQPKTKFGWIILVTPTARKAYPIDVTDLEQTVFAFRDALQSDKYDPQPLAKKLYQKLFRQTSAKQKTTLEVDLETLLGSSKDKTLMWSLDGILRYVPMAALHDGKSYLVEKYRNAIFTKESFLTLTEKDKQIWKALGLGVSEQREGFSALSSVERELKDVVRNKSSKTGVLNGEIKLNKDFKEEETLRLWREGAFPVTHIASHYNFNATDPTSSFLLVGDGQLSFSEMQDKDNLFGSTDLLTLSACDTAMTSNGKEAEGFAYLAQSLGAKSVIASLWKVSDEGTPELMIRFYKQKAENPNLTKAEAFRQAQLSLLKSDTKNPKTTEQSRSDLVRVNGKKIELPLYEKTGKSQFSHPHYWSSFILIGNWR